MMNFLTETTPFFGDDLYLILLIVVPILFGLIAAKTWNVIHGIVVYLLFSFLVIYLLDITSLDLVNKIFDDASLVEYVLAGNYPVNYLWTELKGIEALSKMLTGDAGIHIMLAVHVVLFIISQVIGTMFRRNR